MLFNTFDFIIFFILLVTSIIIIKNKKYQHLILLVASYFFFYYSSNYLIILLVFSTLLDFYVGKLIWNTKNLSRKKLFLIISLAGNLGLLGFFKYVDFTIEQINNSSNVLGLPEIPYLDLALPIGISFYTFQTISYTIDIYRGKLEPSKSLREFALFVAFFPQLVAGPIVRASEFLPQLRERLDQSLSSTNIRQIIIENQNLKLGITLMAIGFLKKMVFADNIGTLANYIFTNPQNFDSTGIILGTLAFGIQIYGDFSGYSDIAIGAALVLGFKLPLNFNKPYFAISPSDFWRRWHISLSSWLRDYLYIPLGGNKKSQNRTYLNLFVVMFLGGLWHGASWNFVVWGLLHAFYLSVQKSIENKFPHLTSHRFFKSKLGIFCSILLTQYLVFFTWIAFRVKNTDDMLYSMQKYVFIDIDISKTLHVIQTNEFPLFLMGLFVILHFISYRHGNLLKYLSNLNIFYWGLFLTTIVFLVVGLHDGNPEDFIYFQF